MSDVTVTYYHSSLSFLVACTWVVITSRCYLTTFTHPTPHPQQILTFRLMLHWLLRTLLSAAMTNYHFILFCPLILPFSVWISHTFHIKLRDYCNPPCCCWKFLLPCLNFAIESESRIWKKIIIDETSAVTESYFYSDKASSLEVCHRVTWQVHTAQKETCWWNLFKSLASLLSLSPAVFCLWEKYKLRLQPAKFSAAGLLPGKWESSRWLECWKCQRSEGSRDTMRLEGNTEQPP